MAFLKQSVLATAACLALLASPSVASTITEATGTAEGSGKVWNDGAGDLNVTLDDATFVFNIFATDLARARRVTSTTTVYAFMGSTPVPVVSDVDILGVFTGQEILDTFNAIKTQIQSSPAAGTVNFFGTDVGYTDFAFTTDTPTRVEATGSISYFNAARSTPLPYEGNMRIEFALTSPVPLPASLPLALGGIALLGAVRRKPRAT